MVTRWLYGATCLLPPDEVKTHQHAHLPTPCDWLRVDGLFVWVGVRSARVLQGSGAVVAVVGSSLWALSPEPVQLWSIPTITDIWQTAAHSSSGLSGQSTCVCTARGKLKATHIRSNSCFNPPHCWLLSVHPFSPPLSIWLSKEWNIIAHQGWAQKKRKTLKLEQRPCVHVLAGVHLCLLLVYYSVVVKARSLNLLYLKTWEEDWLYKVKNGKER